MNRLRSAYYPPMQDALTRFFREQFALVDRQVFSDLKAFADLDLSAEDDRLRRLHCAYHYRHITTGSGQRD